MKPLTAEGGSPSDVAPACRHGTAALEENGGEAADLISNAQVTPPGVARAPKRRWEAVAALFARALAAGATRKGLTTVEWELSGDCEFPTYREHHAVPTAMPTVRKDGGVILHDGATVPFVEGEDHEWVVFRKRLEERDMVEVGPGTRQPLTVETWVRCRQCASCRKAKAAHWRLRAIEEVKMAPRTWFGTLTFKPEKQFELLSIARHKAAQSAVDFDALSAVEQFRGRVSAAGPVVTKWLKRLRKHVKPFRYLIVAEEHRSGAPHFHILLHEGSAFEPIRYAILDASWKAQGFSQWRLVKDDAREASYVCKYIAKTQLARVRASKEYGKLA